MSEKIKVRRAIKQEKQGQRRYRAVLQGYYLDLRRREKEGEDFSKVEEFLAELRELIANDGEHTPDEKLVVNG